MFCLCITFYAPPDDDFYSYWLSCMFTNFVHKGKERGQIIVFDEAIWTIDGLIWLHHSNAGNFFGLFFVINVPTPFFCSLFLLNFKCLHLRYVALLKKFIPIEIAF